MFKEKNCVMSVENEALVHRFHMDIFQKRDSAVDEILAPDFIWLRM